MRSRRPSSPPPVVLSSLRRPSLRRPSLRRPSLRRPSLRRPSLPSAVVPAVRRSRCRHPSPSFSSAGVPRWLRPLLCTTGALPPPAVVPVRRRSGRRSFPSPVSPVGGCSRWSPVGCLSHCLSFSLAVIPVGRPVGGSSRRPFLPSAVVLVGRRTSLVASSAVHDGCTAAAGRRSRPPSFRSAVVPVACLSRRRLFRSPVVPVRRSRRPFHSRVIHTRIHARNFPKF